LLPPFDEGDEAMVEGFAVPEVAPVEIMNLLAPTMNNASGSGGGNTTLSSASPIEKPKEEDLTLNFGSFEGMDLSGLMKDSFNGFGIGGLEGLGDLSGLTIPEGFELPAGFTIPEGFTLPQGFNLPSNLSNLFATSPGSPSSNQMDFSSSSIRSPSSEMNITGSLNDDEGSRSAEGLEGSTPI
jgi:hypothetical protein